MGDKRRHQALGEGRGALGFEHGHSEFHVCAVTGDPAQIGKGGTQSIRNPGHATEEFTSDRFDRTSDGSGALATVRGQIKRRPSCQNRREAHVRSATDIDERIRTGFADLLKTLRQVDEDGDTAKRIRSNTAAREKAIARVRSEYAALRRDPPSDLALSITARRSLSIGTETLTYIPDEAAE